MKKIIFLSASVCIIAAAIAFKPNVAPVKANAPFQPVAVIELFTSQGCSSCPAADELLARTISNAKKEDKKIFALSFHVDYWDHLGWADPFSTKEYSQRQNEYAEHLKLEGVYTPQMIVNGNTEFVGSDEDKLKQALNSALQNTPAAVFKSLTVTAETGGAPLVKYVLEGNYAGCKINFALISLKETTVIKRGENGGRTLTNENVVRQFISAPATADGEVSFKKAGVPQQNNMAVVAYIQRTNDMQITGSAMTEIKQ